MKVRTTHCATFVWLLLLLLCCNACERRPLEDEYTNMARMLLSIDWSKSSIPKDADGQYRIHRATLLLYPHSGGTPLEYNLEGDVTQREIEVPIGTYSAILFNETTDETDWKSIYFTGTEAYKTFAAHVKPEVQKGFYTRSTENNLCQQPDPLAAWSLDKLEVTRSMVEATRNGAPTKNTDGQTRALTDIQPSPRSQRVQIKARVINLAGAIQATALVKGVVTGVMMASGQVINEYASHAVLLNGRQMEANGKDGTIGAMMYIFGVKSGEEYELKTDFVLTDGTLFSPPPIKDTALFKPGTEGDDADLLVDVGIGSSILPSPENPNPDPDIPPITLPETDANAEVEVGSWDEVIIPMN